MPNVGGPSARNRCLKDSLEVVPTTVNKYLLDAEQIVHRVSQLAFPDHSNEESEAKKLYYLASEPALL
jgi:hypothetical protein